MFRNGDEEKVIVYFKKKNNPQLFHLNPRGWLLPSACHSSHMVSEAKLAV